MCEYMYVYLKVKEIILYGLGMAFKFWVLLHASKPMSLGDLAIQGKKKFRPTCII